MCDSDEDGAKSHHSASLDLTVFTEEMWTDRQRRRLRKGRNVGSWLLDGLSPTSLIFKLCVNLFQQLQERAEESFFL